MKDYGNGLMVSIRCLTYNHEPYIRQCLEGFVMQKTNFRYEAIVHDDASTDGTAAIIKEYADKYPDIIKPIYETENQYSKHDGSIRRIMNERMYGKYIAVCEGDDYWTDPLKLQKQVDFLENNPDYVLSYSDRIIVDAMNRPLICNKVSGKSGYLFDYLLFKGNPITTAGVCYRKNIYNQALEIIHKANMKGLSMGDFPLWIVMSTMGKFGYIDEKMIAYRILQNSASHSDDYRKIVKFSKDELRVKKYFYKELSGKSADDRFEKEYYKVLIRKMAQYDRKIFMIFYKEGIKRYPQLLICPKLLFFFMCKFFHVL